MKTQATTPSASSTRPGARTVVTLGAIITAAFMGSVIVTPLYSLYQAELGFSDVTLTLVYATYVVGNIVALLLFGQVSDQLGRKRVALPGLALAAASSLSFLFATSTVWLFVGRLLVGLAVGILSGTGTSWLAERYGPGHRRQATVVAATANLIGIALGPLVAGLLAEYVAAPLRLPLLVYLGFVAVVAVGVARTSDPREGRVLRIGQVRVHPRIGVPSHLLRMFGAPAITGFVTFSLGGLYFALIPSIVIHELHVTNVAVGGLIVFELGAVAATMIVLGRRLRPLTAMTGGLASLVPAVALVVLAQDRTSLPLLLGATALAGVTMSLGYRGSLEIVNELAPDDRRAEVVSTYFIACFVGNSIPVIGVSTLSMLTSPLVASLVFACTVAVLALVALAWQRLDPAVAHLGRGEA